MVDQTQELSWWETVRQQDDRKSFDRLYLTHWEKLYAIAWSRTKDEAVSKDILQDVFVNFWERRKDIIIQRSITQYLTGALKNRLIDYFKSEQVRQRVFALVIEQMDSILQQPVKVGAYHEVERILDEELDKMPDNMRKSFLLKLDNNSTPDITKQLNLAEQTVSNLLTEASKRLRKNLPHRFHDKAMPVLIAFLQVVHNLLTNR